MKQQLRQVVIESCGETLRANLHETPTAELIWSSLPIEGEPHWWGDELFVQVSLEVSVEPDARQIVERGSLCFWCESRILSLALGPTPISLREECRLPAPVNVWGRLEGDGTPLRQVQSGDSLRIVRAQP